MGYTEDEGRPDIAMEGAKGRVGLMGAVDRPKDLDVALLSLKRYSAESAFALKK